MKKVYKVLVGIFAFSTLVILVLLINYNNQQKVHAYNFKRKLVYPINNYKTYDLGYNSYYLAGNYRDTIYLGNFTAPLHVLKINALLLDTQHVQIKINKNEFVSSGSYTLSVDSNNFYLFNGYARSILKGNTSNWNAFNDSISKPYFSLSAPINDHSIVFRYVSNESGNNSLRKESKGAKSIENSKILEKQIDGLFCTDGILQYNKSLNQLIYLYYYRNEILIIDTNMNLIRKLKTIDNTARAKFKLAEVKSNHSVTFLEPPLMVNAKCRTWGNYLFVQSKLMGQGEEYVLFKDAAVIDVYDLKASKYLYSFYLTNYTSSPINEFNIQGDYALAISGKYITRYALKLPDQ